jgi:hypothetical protein
MDGRPRPRRLRLVVGGLLPAVFAAVLGAALPAAPAPLIPAIGHVEGEGYHYGGGSCTLDLDFVGRMPAGSSAYQILFGRMSATRACDPTWTLSMHGTTLSGYFDWTCVGTSLSKSFTCRTAQKAGSFTLRLRMTETHTASNPPYWEHYMYEGTYQAKIG